MNLFKIFARILIILGPTCIAVGFISLFFFQIPHGEITLPNSFRSDNFYLEKGKTYSIKASGSNYPFGSSGGEMTFYLSDGRPVISLAIQFSFDGDSMAEEIIIGDFSIPVSGDYYFQYMEEYSTIYHPVKLVVEESLVEHFIGFDSFEVMIFGTILLIAGVFLNWIFNRMIIRASEEEYLLEEKDENFDMTEEEYFPGELDENFDIIEFEEKKCPTCGFIDDGLYCSNCGSRMRKNS